MRLFRATEIIQRFARARQLSFAVVTVALATAAFLPGRGVLDRTQWGLGYIAVIVFVASVAGERGAVAAALASFIAWDVLFLPPYRTLLVADPRDWLLLCAFLVVGLAIGVRTAQSRSREAEAQARQQDADALCRLSAELLAAEDTATMARRVLGALEAVTDAESIAVYVASEAGLEPIAWTPEGPAPHDDLAAALGEHARDEGEPLLRLAIPLVASRRRCGAVVLARPASAFSANELRLVRSVANLATSYLEQTRLREQAVQAEALREADRLKSTFVSSVSHQLKTPLASALATVTSLLEPGGREPADRVDAELRAVVGDLQRLEGNIRDLLDLAELESDAWRSRAESYDLGDVIGYVLGSLGRQRDRVRLDVDDRLPAVQVDFGQIARALGNIVENALRYSPAGSTVIVGAGIEGPWATVHVDDEGEGVPAEEREAVFGKFYRCKGRNHPPSSSGLGLAICRQIVEAHGGAVRVEEAPGGGARFVVVLPVDWSGEAA